MPSPSNTRDNPSDDFLITAMLAGDSAALRKLMHRYDRLVRYHVYRISKSHCLSDPHWLDAIASETWSGFVERCRVTSDDTIDSVPALLSRITRNRSISALRRVTGTEQTQSLDSRTSTIDQYLSADEDQQPGAVAERLELLEALRISLSDLEEADRIICEELPLIMERRWKEAGKRLGMSESTLRSRWQVILAKLRRTIAQKTGENIAP